MANRVDTDQSVLDPRCLLLYLNSTVVLGNYLQQTTSADDMFRSICSWRFNTQVKPHVQISEGVGYRR